MTVMTAMTSMALAQSSGDTGFSFGTLLLFVGGAVLLADKPARDGRRDHLLDGAE